MIRIAFYALLALAVLYASCRAAARIDCAWSTKCLRGEARVIAGCCVCAEVRRDRR